jgi:hypothetical protein
MSLFLFSYLSYFTGLERHSRCPSSFSSTYNFLGLERHSWYSCSFSSTFHILQDLIEIHGVLASLLLLNIFYRNSHAFIVSCSFSSTYSIFKRLYSRGIYENMMSLLFFFYLSYFTGLERHSRCPGYFIFTQHILQD